MVLYAYLLNLSITLARLIFPKCPIDRFYRTQPGSTRIHIPLRPLNLLSRLLRLSILIIGPKNPSDCIV